MLEAPTIHTNVGPDRPIDRYFRRKGFRAKLRASLFAPYWDGFIESMERRGYRRYTTYRTIEIALPFGCHVAAMGLGLADLTDKLIERYLRMRRHRESRRCFRHLLDYLRGLGVVKVSATQELGPQQPLLDEYLAFQRAHRGIGERRLSRHRVHVSAFLDASGIACALHADRLTPTKIHKFVVARARKVTRAERKSLCAALRSFLRFLQMRGYLSRELVSCVPVIPSFKLDRLPRAIAWEDITKILAVIDRSTCAGRRDYGMLLLLATYGIRSGQLCALRLEDIDWRRQTIRIRAAKGGRDTLLPLRPSVGEAIVDYLRNARPRSSCRQLFLRVRAPIQALVGGVSVQIRPYARRAGVAPPFGAHAWRHACATRMLAHGHPLKTIRDVLGHRSIESTFIYTKVDIGMLRQAALDWPETPL